LVEKQAINSTLPEKIADLWLIVVQKANLYRIDWFTILLNSNVCSGEPRP
jgi:hypothetical protein